jgi:cbb3-type cytochrome oxidase subunit 3
VDINSIRIAVTLATFAAFLLIVCWAFAPKRRNLLDEQARSILEEDDR